MGASAAAKLVRNTVVNGVGNLTAIVVGLALTPFLIHRLGLQTYGVWALALTIAFAGGYASLSELGIEAATVRYVAESHAERDLAALSRSVGTSLAVFCAVAAVLAPLAVALAHPLVLLLGVPIHERHDATVCFALVGAQLIFEIPARAFVAVLEGVQRYAVYQLVESGRGLLQAALYVLAILQGRGIVGLAGAFALSSLVSLVALCIAAHRAVPGLRASPLRASRAELARVLGFGSEVFSLRILSTVYRQMDRVIIGVALGTRPVGVYEIANKVSLGVGGIGSLTASAVVPAAASLRRHGALMRDMFVRGSCYAMAVALPFEVAAFIFARPLLLSWIGPSAAPAVGAVRLFCAYGMLQSTNNVASTMIFGVGQIRLPLAVGALATLLNLGLSIALVRPLGFSGVIVGTLIANGLAWPVLVWYYLRVFDCPLGEWWRRLIAPNLPGLALQVAVSLPLYAAVGAHSRSLILTLCMVAASVAVSLAAFVSIGLRGEDRRALLHTARSAAGLRSPEVSA